MVSLAYAPWDVFISLSLTGGSGTTEPSEGSMGCVLVSLTLGERLYRPLSPVRESEIRK